MSNRLEVLVSGMNPLAKFGCGATFMGILFGIVWLISFYTYHTFWVINVGKQEYKEVLTELPPMQAKLDQLSGTAVEKTQLAALVAEQTAHDLKKEDILPLQKENVELHAELQGLKVSLLELQANIAVINSANLEKTLQLTSTIAEITSKNAVMEHNLQHSQEELILLKAAVVNVARDALDREGSPRTR